MTKIMTIKKYKRFSEVRDLATNAYIHKDLLDVEDFRKIGKQLAKRGIENIFIEDLAFYCSSILYIDCTKGLITFNVAVCIK